jgi:putative pyruvate formate lyase activating enzyme
MSDLARLRIWDDPAIRGALSVPGRRREPAPAKFRIAATVAARLNPLGSSEDALWAELDRLTPRYFSCAGRPSGRARHCQKRRTGRAC